MIFNYQQGLLLPGPAHTLGQHAFLRQVGKAEGFDVRPGRRRRRNMTLCRHQGYIGIEISPPFGEQPAGFVDQATPILLLDNELIDVADGPQNTVDMVKALLRLMFI
jgi:hypothetical protein